MLLLAIAALSACTAGDDGAASPFTPASVAGVELVTPDGWVRTDLDAREVVALARFAPAMARSYWPRS